MEIHPVQREDSPLQEKNGEIIVEFQSRIQEVCKPVQGIRVEIVEHGDVFDGLRRDDRNWHCSFGGE